MKGNEVDSCRYNDSAETLYSLLESSLQVIPDYRTIYTILDSVYARVLNQNTSFVTIKLVGRFAKTDYLLKENNATAELTHSVNDFRARLKSIDELSVDELEVYYPYDIKTLAQFIYLVYKSPIPKSILEIFPDDVLYNKKVNSFADYIRVIVNDWDGEYIYCTCEDFGNELKILYGKECGIYKYDWSYISNIIRKNTQLNIIKPIDENGIIIPELIILEPDYLVDISSIASCFEMHAEDSILYLINKIKPNVNTSAILLGNLAGQLLDEEIHSKEHETSYNDSVKSFFKKNSLALLTTSIESDFHLKAKQQKENIHTSIGVELPQKVSIFDFEKTLLEPSFFCEMLGLQGRMDLLQSDFSLLIEQKSGKCGFPQTNIDTPIALKKHYVQMLLYMAILRYNYSEQYKQNNYKLNAFLLYSKYKNSLLGLGFAPELLYDSLKIRNEIVSNEYKYSEEGVDVLKELIPEDLNKNNINNKLWSNYTYPQLKTLLSPISNASELEREYYLRFLKFIETEHIYSKTGNRTKENSGFASKWHDTLDEKRNAGNIYDKLTLIYPIQDNEGVVDEVELRFNQTVNQDVANFRVGDIVILYPYGREEVPDLRKAIVHRCSIVSIDAETVKLSLKAPQTNVKLFLKDSDKVWAIEHDFMESSYSSLYKGVHKFLSAPKERRDLVLLQRNPKIDATKRLNGDYGSFNQLALKVKQAEEFFLIIGPPGTGKTSFGLLTTLKEELTEKDSNVLLLSYTNRAVDEICSKLVEENIDFIRIGGKNSCSEQYKEFLFENKTQNCNNITELNNLISNTRVFVGTTASINGNLSLFDLKQFNLAIIDEASQILEPNIIGILSEERDGVPVVKKFVMIGDHKQLPAIVQQPKEESKTDSKILNDIYLRDCSLSMFERLLRKYAENETVTYMLAKQGRMHAELAEFPNMQFYNNKLDIVPLPHQTAEMQTINDDDALSNILSSHRVIFFEAKNSSANLNNKVNRREAEIIVDLIHAIYIKDKHNFDIDKTVGVIVPYRNQIATIKNILQCRYPNLNLDKITIDTVERFQGSQRDCIIYGLTISERYQLNFLTENSFIEDDKIIDRKLNVAMTRAKKQMIFVGNDEVISENELYSQLISYVKQKKSYFKYNYL